MQTGTGARVLRYLFGRLSGWLLLLWARTWRVVVEVHSVHLDAANPGAAERTIYAFWHGCQMGLLAMRRRTPISVMVSHSADGDLQTGILRSAGLRVVRGSASRGGATGLRPLIRRVRRGESACFAVDGPRGPLRVAKRGALVAAQLGRGIVIPVATAASRSLVLGRSWDQFEIPWPFARVAVVLGIPALRREPVRDAETLDQALHWARSRALDLVSLAPKRQQAAATSDGLVSSGVRREP